MRASDITHCGGRCLAGDLAPWYGGRTSEQRQVDKIIERQIVDSNAIPCIYKIHNRIYVYVYELFTTDILLCIICI